jgi:hypothetical protein
MSSPLWILWPDINSVWKLLSRLCGSRSLKKGRLCLLSVLVSSICSLTSILLRFFVCFTCHTCFMYIQYTCKAFVSPGSVQQIMPHHLKLTLQQQSKHLNGRTPEDFNFLIHTQKFELKRSRSHIATDGQPDSTGSVQQIMPHYPNTSV